MTGLGKAERPESFRTPVRLKLYPWRVIPNPVAVFANGGGGSDFLFSFLFCLREFSLLPLDMCRASCVYILASRSRNLYTAATATLEPPIRQHPQTPTPRLT